MNKLEPQESRKQATHLLNAAFGLSEGQISRSGKTILHTPKHCKPKKLTKKMRKKLRNNKFVQAALDSTHVKNWRGKKVLNIVTIGDCQYCKHPKCNTLVRIR